MIRRMTPRLPLIPLAISVLVAGCDDRPLLGPEFLARTAAGTSLTATAYLYSAINLAWQDNASNETGWEVHRSTTGPAGTFSLRSTEGANVVGAADGGLQGSTEYCYKVRSFRTAGRGTTYGEFSNIACATTPPSPLPAAPSGVTAAPRSGSQIEVTWVDNASDEAGFRVERSGSSSGPWTALAAKSANATSHTDYVPQEQQFCYRVLAFNSYGASTPSDADCTAVPAAPTNLAGSVTAGAVELVWSDNSSVEDGYQVERRDGSSSWSVIATVPANAVGYRDPGVMPNQTYWYVVRATRDGGTSAGSGAVPLVVATTIPNAPVLFAAAEASSSRILVRWADQSANEEGFRVERSADGGVSWTTATIVPLNATEAMDEGVLAEVEVCYRVIAFNDVGDSAPSNTACGRPLAAPTDLTATGVDGATIDFAWTDNSSSEDGHEIVALECYEDYFYGSYCYLSWSVAVLGPNTTSFRFTGDSSAYGYRYVVFAFRNDELAVRVWSDSSNQATPTAPPGGSDAGGPQP